MQLSLRPYVTTGMALVGASVIAAAPLQPVVPAEIQVPNPAVQVVERGVQLTANEIQTAVNNAIYAFVARPTVAGAELLGRLLEPIIGEAGVCPPLAALGFAGPLISGGGSVGTALQAIVDSSSFEELLTNLIGGVGTVIDGSANGGYGPDLGPLTEDILTAVSPDLAALAALGFFPAILAGGLINEQEPGNRRVCKLSTWLHPPGVPWRPQRSLFPAQSPRSSNSSGRYFGLLGGSEPASLMMAPPPEPRRIEDGVNDALYLATAITLGLVTRAAPLLEPILGDDAAQFLAIGTLGLIGPLIGGTGGLGHAVQDLVGSDDSPNFLDNALDLVRLPIDGAVNGGRFGPNLAPLLPLPPTIPPPPATGAPVNNVFAPGLIRNANYNYNLLPGGIGLQPTMTGVNLITPGTIPTLQGLVTQVFGSNNMSARKVAGDNVKLAGAEDIEKDAPKRNRPLLNIVRHSLGADEDGAKGASATETSGRHRIGTPVRDLINKVVNGGRDKGDDDDNGEGPKDEASDTE